MEGSLSGTVLLLFQPAEEALAGARHIVEAGTLDGVTAVHGLHVWPGLQSGVFASRVSLDSCRQQPSCCTFVLPGWKSSRTLTDCTRHLLGMQCC